eukprot:NODE_6113_length_925_cov_18.826683_g5522_i0.p1 GENE.NODE_6113_length_925_cov_18.826683_g5522_i0~~NODE_6113_length_925_cov_18.826683_g5522_i0.p1  ORF type:complete len:169 (+),score=17.83 NODE_6113_length_925_cov_18.826683_g5522_i0:47-553(+)
MFCSKYNVAYMAYTYANYPNSVRDLTLLRSPKSVGWGERNLHTSNEMLVHFLTNGCFLSGCLGWLLPQSLEPNALSTICFVFLAGYSSARLVMEIVEGGQIALHLLFILPEGRDMFSNMQIPHLAQIARSYYHTFMPPQAFQTHSLPPKQKQRAQSRSASPSEDHPKN